MHCNVCPIAPVTVHSIWTHKSVTVSRNGVVTIVPKVSASRVAPTPAIRQVAFSHIFFFPLELCDMDCGQNGRCVGETCTCNEGWGGEFCNRKLCDARCNEHGQCKNGTCLCVTGWNGKHCTIEGCPGGCTNHGQCRVNGEGLWECRCYDGWDGVDCAVPLEQNCDDNKDNDKGNHYIHITESWPQPTEFEFGILIELNILRRWFGRL